MNQRASRSSRIRELGTVEIPRDVRMYISGDDRFRDDALASIDAWWTRSFYREYRQPNDPRMDFVSAVAYYVRGNYDRAIFRLCICEGLLVHGWQSQAAAKAAHELYRSRIAEAESLVGKLVVELPTSLVDPIDCQCQCNICEPVSP